MNMDVQNPNQSNMGLPERGSQSGQTENKEPRGPVVGIIIIITVLIAGAVYFGLQESWKTSQTPESILSAPDPKLESLEGQGASDELQVIEQDIGDTDLGNIDQELGDIERELGF